MAARTLRDPDLSSVDGSDDDRDPDNDRVAGSPGGRVSDRAPGSRPTRDSSNSAPTGASDPNFMNFYSGSSPSGMFTSPILPLSATNQNPPSTVARPRTHDDETHAHSHFDAVPIGRLSGDHDQAARIAASAIEALRQSLQLRGDDDTELHRRSPLQHAPVAPLATANAPGANAGISPERNISDFLFDEDDDGFASGPSGVPRSEATLGARAQTGSGGRTMAMVDQALIAAIWGKASPANDSDTQGASQPSSHVSPVETYALEPPAPDRSLDDIIASFERNNGELPPYVVCVQALDPRTTSKALQDVFFPMGSHSAVVLYREEDIANVMHATATVIIESQEYVRTQRPDDQVPVPYPLPSLIRRRVVGLVFFKSEDIARFAAQKMHDFVPHGQSNPLHSAVCSGAEFASAVKRCLADPDACINRLHTFQPPTVSAAQSHNASLQDINPIGVSRRLITALHTMFGGMKKPLPTLGHTALRFASVLVEADSGRGIGAPDRIIAPCSALLEACLEGDAVDASDCVALLSEGISAQYRGVLRVVDLAARRVADILKAEDYRAELLVERFQVPLCKIVLNGLVFSPDRMRRIGCASAAASLFDQNLIAGSPFALCLRLFTTKILNQPQTPQRDGLVEALVIFAACTKTCNRLRSAVGSTTSNLTIAGADLLAGPTTYPFPADPPAVEGLERDFVSALTRFREELASLHHDAAGSSSGTSPSYHHAGWPLQRPDEVLPSARPRTTTSAHDSSTGSITGVNAGDVTPPASPGSHASAPLGYPQPAGAANMSQAVARAAISGLPPARHVEVVPPTTVPSTLNADILPCTVYVTRIPASLSEPRLRTLLVHHGELNKVRLYATAKRGQHDREELAFAFVEFRTQAAARNLVSGLDRATLHLVGSSPERATWHVTPHGAAPDFPSDANVLVVSTLRCSPARSAIHDHDPRDAVFDTNARVRECLFGVLPRQAGPLPTQPPQAANTSKTLVGVQPSSRPTSATSTPVASAGNTPSRPQGTATVGSGLNVSAQPWGRGGSLDGPLPSERRIVHMSTGYSSPSAAGGAMSSHNTSVLSADSSGFIVTGDQ